MTMAGEGGGGGGGGGGGEVRAVAVAVQNAAPRSGDRQGGGRDQLGKTETLVVTLTSVNGFTGQVSVTPAMMDGATALTGARSLRPRRASISRPTRPRP